MTNTKKSKKALIIILIIAGVLIATAITGLVVVKSYLNKIDKIEYDPEDVIKPEDEDFETDNPDDNDYTDDVGDIDIPDDTDDPENPDDGNNPDDVDEPDNPDGNNNSGDVDNPSSSEDDPSTDSNKSDKTDKNDKSNTGKNDNENSDNSKSSTGKKVTEPEEIIIKDATPLEGKDVINIMLIGQDRRQDEGRRRSDSMILCSINVKTGKVSMTSFLRDIYVKIPGGYSDNRLNAAYRFGSFPLMAKTFKVNFGIDIDGFFEVDFTQFTKIINTLGGVDIELTQKEVDHLQEQGYANLKVGLNHLDGNAALAFSRIRKIDSDFQRARRQRDVLTSIFNKFKSCNISELNDLANVVLPMLKTNMADSKLLELLAKVIPLINKMQVSRYVIPYSGTYYHTYIRGMYVFIIDFDAVREKLQNTIIPFS